MRAGIGEDRECSRTRPCQILPDAGAVRSDDLLAGGLVSPFVMFDDFDTDPPSLATQGLIFFLSVLFIFTIGALLLATS
jgi:hypothetical protein